MVIKNKLKWVIKTLQFFTSQGGEGGVSWHIYSAKTLNKIPAVDNDTDPCVFPPQAL